MFGNFYAQRKCSPVFRTTVGPSPSQAFELQESPFPPSEWRCKQDRHSARVREGVTVITSWIPSREHHQATRRLWATA